MQKKASVPNEGKGITSHTYTQTRWRWRAPTSTHIESSCWLYRWRSHPDVITKSNSNDVINTCYAFGGWMDGWTTLRRTLARNSTIHVIVVSIQRGQLIRCGWYWRGIFRHSVSVSVWLNQPFSSSHAASSKNGNSICIFLSIKLNAMTLLPLIFALYFFIYVIKRFICFSRDFNSDSGPYVNIADTFYTSYSVNCSLSFHSIFFRLPLFFPLFCGILRMWWNVHCENSNENSDKSESHAPTEKKQQQQTILCRMRYVLFAVILKLYLPNVIGFLTINRNGKVCLFHTYSICNIYFVCAQWVDFAMQPIQSIDPKWISWNIHLDGAIVVSYRISISQYAHSIACQAQIAYNVNR